LFPSLLKEPIWFPVYIREKKFLKEKKGIIWLSVFPAEDGKIRGPISLPETHMSPVHFDWEKGELIFHLKIKTDEKSKENFEKLARTISKEEKVPLYTFRCVNCHRLYVLLPKEYVAGWGSKKGKIETVFQCRRCLLEKGQKMAWGIPLIEDWEFKDLF
jgi:hypothetical protein